jgi:hypothetical protein
LLDLARLCQTTQGLPDLASARLNLITVTSREESNALDHVRELLAADLSKVPVDELAQGVREAEMLFDESQRWVGRLASELRRRELSWADISRLTGLPSTTVRNRVTKAEEAR